MKTETVRGIIAIAVVITVLVVGALLFLLPALGGMQNVSDHVANAKEFVAVFSGIIGVIVGYYFGKKDQP